MTHTCASWRMRNNERVTSSLGGQARKDNLGNTYKHSTCEQVRAYIRTAAVPGRGGRMPSNGRHFRFQQHFQRRPALRTTVSNNVPRVPVGFVQPRGAGWHSAPMACTEEKSVVSSCVCVCVCVCVCALLRRHACMSFGACHVYAHADMVAWQMVCACQLCMYLCMHVRMYMCYVGMFLVQSSAMTCIDAPWAPCIVISKANDCFYVEHIQNAQPHSWLHSQEEHMYVCSNAMQRSRHMTNRKSNSQLLRTCRRAHRICRQGGPVCVHQGEGRRDHSAPHILHAVIPIVQEGFFFFDHTQGTLVGLRVLLPRKVVCLYSNIRTFRCDYMYQHIHKMVLV